MFRRGGAYLSRRRGQAEGRADLAAAVVGLARIDGRTDEAVARVSVIARTREITRRRVLARGVHRTRVEQTQVDG